MRFDCAFLIIYCISAAIFDLGAANCIAIVHVVMLKKGLRICAIEKKKVHTTPTASLHQSARIDGAERVVLRGAKK